MTSIHKSSFFARRRVLAALLLPLAVWAGAAHAATLDEIKARGYMVVVTEDDFKPFEFIQDGKPMGFDHEMLAALKKYAPFEIRQEILPWPGILAGVSTGKYDMALTAVLMTKERNEALEFASPIADATHYYVKRTSDSSIKSIKDLDGKTVGVQVGSAFLNRLPELQAMLDKTGGKIGKIVEYTSYPDAYQDLALKRTDYVINTVINLKALATEKPGIFELGQAVSGTAYPAWAMKKGNTELRDFINGFIAEQKANGVMPALQKKWFGQAFTLPATYTPE
jgi:polar amino acid transport system substrate-binding protein